VELIGPLGDVRFHVPLASKYGILDCRLVLVLDDLAKVLKRHDVVAVRIDNFYRPHSHLPGQRSPSQHSHGLAADIVGFTLADGRSLLVERDWHPVIGDPVCGPDSDPVDPTEETLALRDLVCEIVRERLFHHLLTPNFNAAHADHLHADIKRGARELGVR
jgi:hypothetical protein